MINGVVVTFIDISKQMHAEAALTESEEQRVALLDQSEEGIILVDFATGSITDSNPAFQKLIGRHACELKNMKFRHLVPKAGMEKIKKLYRKQMQLSCKEDAVRISSDRRGDSSRWKCTPGPYRLAAINTCSISLKKTKNRYIICCITP